MRHVSRDSWAAIQQAARTILHFSPPQYRSEPEAKALRFALRDRLVAGDSLPEIVAGLRARGVNGVSPARLIDDGNWAPEPVSAEEEALREKWSPARFGGPKGHDILGTEADPGPMRQWRWLEDWWRWDPLERKLYWGHGPGPAEPGSLIWPGVLAAFAEAKGSPRWP